MMGLINLFSLVAIVTAVHSKSLFKRNVFMEISSMECVNSSKMMRVHECRIYKVEKNLFAVDLGLSFAQDLEEPNYEVHFKVDTIQHQSRRKQRFVDITTDACKGLKYGNSNLLLRGIFRELNRSSNVPNNCPLKANTVYSAKHFAIRSNFFPPYTPDMNFSLIMEYFYNRALMGYQHLKGIYTSKK